ncbi:MAG: Holliday junction resolvase RuvX [Candidatus Magasanikbacteria bacterium]|jgi:putative holliday junction resolvase|nr:Holliday junction resolvase RuvX [Candidatus Magasanikbacteria bacterium]MBT4071201.1 Holliday junction resolvase RuvX [Candidatus Magasanikbacteria bacterium]
MNILAVDHGEKRIGLAWAQVGLDLVLPYGLIEKSGKEGQLEALKKLIVEERIDRVVFGLPFHLESGEETRHTKEIREFAEDLGKSIEAEICFEDERLTSQEADTMGGEVSRDEKAAMIILQSYLKNLQ